MRGQISTRRRLAIIAVGVVLVTIAVGAARMAGFVIPAVVIAIVGSIGIIAYVALENRRSAGRP